MHRGHVHCVLVFPQMPMDWTFAHQTSTTSPFYPLIWVMFCCVFDGLSPHTPWCLDGLCYLLSPATFLLFSPPWWWLSARLIVVCHPHATAARQSRAPPRDSNVISRLGIYVPARGPDPRRAVRGLLRLVRFVILLVNCRRLLSVPALLLKLAYDGTAVAVPNAPVPLRTGSSQGSTLNSIGRERCLLG